MKKDFDRWNVEKQALDVRKGADCHEREIWWCSIGVNVGSEQHSQTSDFSRPVIIIRKFTRDIFWAVPLTSKLKKLPFRFRVAANDIENEALIMQMRAYDKRRLVRKIGVVEKAIFAELLRTIAETLQTTSPALAGLSEAEANVYPHAI